LRWFILKRQEEHDIKLKGIRLDKICTATLKNLLIKRYTNACGISVMKPGRHTEIPPEQNVSVLDPAITGSEDTAVREELNLKPPKVLEVRL
jgi:hypothetical protein